MSRVLEAAAFFRRERHEHVRLVEHGRPADELALDPREGFDLPEHAAPRIEDERHRERAGAVEREAERGAHPHAGLPCEHLTDARVVRAADERVALDEDETFGPGIGRVLAVDEPDRPRLERALTRELHGAPASADPRRVPGNPYDARGIAEDARERSAGVLAGGGKHGRSAFPEELAVLLVRVLEAALRDGRDDASSSRREERRRSEATSGAHCGGGDVHASGAGGAARA